MDQPVKIYAPQAVVKRQNRQALTAWLIVLSISAAWILLIASAPVARKNGFSGFADPVYKFFSYLCHQMPQRSFYFDDHPLAVCARCFGFYSGFLLGIIIYPLIWRLREIEPLPRIWLFAAMIPMGVDWSLAFFGIWGNTHYSRFITGLMLGAACAFFIVPAVVEIGYWFGAKFQQNSQPSGGKFGVD